MYKASGLNIWSKVSGSSAPIDADSGIGVKANDRARDRFKFAIPAPIFVSLSVQWLYHRFVLLPQGFYII
jgi:hypothetical protein